ncbi:restriction endonuclease subunit S [Streptomyces sp. GD-15H]|uniref:restriction endonuclease subunit S n=1 Tax=Streptomyces sp. GD-15H TaxID=3129112 RepID=UPI00324D1A8A
MSDWRTYTLGEVTKNFDSVRVPVKSAERVPGPYPYYGASGVVDHVANFLFDGDFLLIAEDGENLRTRKTPVAFMAEGKFWVNNHAHVVQGNHLANTRFLCYAFSCTDISGHLSGSTQPKLTQASLNAVKVKLPDRAQQDAVVGVLGALDEKIAVNKRIAATSHELGLALFVQAVMDGVGIEVAVDSISSVLVRGIAPKYSTSPDDLVVLNQKCIRDGRVNLTYSRLTLRGKVKDAKLLSRNDVLVNSTGVGTLGRVARWTSDEDATVDSHITIVRFDEAQVDPVCAGFAMLRAQPEIEAMGEGSTGQTELRRTQLGRLEISLPSKERQRELRPKLDSLEERIDQAVHESQILATLRDTLLPQLVSGRLRVKDAEKIVEDAV